MRSLDISALISRGQKPSMMREPSAICNAKEALRASIFSAARSEWILSRLAGGKKSPAVQLAVGRPYRERLPL
jgi:hypothetical protein